MIVTAEYDGTDYVATNAGAQYEHYGAGDLLLEHSPIHDAAMSQVIEYELGADAVIDRAVFEVKAAPGGERLLASVGQVRQAGPSEIVVDFGRMVTVGEIRRASPSSIHRWNGVEFVVVADNDAELEGVQMGEVQTERLKLVYDGAEPDLDGFSETATVVLPALPTSLELLIDGTVVWSQRQGTSAGLTDPVRNPDAPNDIGFSIDRTDEFARAFEASGGPVRVEFRAQTPGDLVLKGSVEEHRVHRVAFPDGPARTITFGSEGAFSLDLPLPAGSDSWNVGEVAMSIAAIIDDKRIIPASGPAPSDDAHLRLVPGRLVLGVAPQNLRDLATSVSGVRVAVRGGTEGGDLTGRFLTDVGGRPGESVPGGEFTPAAVDPGDDIRWITLATAEPVDPAGAWIELGAGFGTVDWVLTSDGDTSASPGTEISLRTPGGAIRALPVLEGVGPLLGSLRLITVPDDDRPIAAVSIGLGTAIASGASEATVDSLVSGTAAAGVIGPVALTPSPDGTRVRIVDAEARHPQAQTLSLAGVVTTPGDYTFADITVSYREPS